MLKRTLRRDHGDGGGGVAAVSDWEGGQLGGARVRTTVRVPWTSGKLAPKFVVPYRESGKNDGNEAESICEAMRRPNMRFVPVKSAEQQAFLALHRVRQGFVVEKTETVNRLRGLQSEFGVVLAQRSGAVHYMGW